MFLWYERLIINSGKMVSAVFLFPICFTMDFVLKLFSYVLAQLIGMVVSG